MKRWLSGLLLVLMIVPFGLFGGLKSSAEEYPFDLNAKSAVLMDAATGQILYAKDADVALPPASVTKIMTLLLVMEAVDGGVISLADPVTVSEKAASMGGSQVFLEVGEVMSVEEMIKCVVIASANDAALALAEHIAGSEEAFVKRMNDRARELSMTATHFENTNGLDDTVTSHLTSAKDIAIMSRELLKHPKILEYTTIWMDTIRNGAFTLTNTNRLIRFYPGITGLKTGSTAKALFCISATAERNGMHLIAVVMGSPTRDIRNAEVKKLLDFGFSTYSVYRAEEESLGRVRVNGGKAPDVGLTHGATAILLKRGEEKLVKSRTVLPKGVRAPITAGDTIGYIEYTVGDRTVGKCDILATEDVERVSYLDLFMKLLYNMLGAFSK